MTSEAPIACSLGAGDYAERIRWIAALNGRSLRRHEQSDLTLRLVYDAAARSDVARLVAQEQACCAFLDFDVAEAPEGLVLSITAPERAREAAEAIFGEFTGANPQGRASACGCC
jgi:hypothetical protein